MLDQIRQFDAIRRSKAVVIGMIFLVSSVLPACAPCGSISTISKTFSGTGNDGNDKSEKSGRKTGKEQGTERQTYEAKLKKQLSNPSFVFVSANQKDKGGNAVIKSEDDTKIASIPFDTEAAMIAVHPEGKHVYVTCSRSNKILVVDAEENKLIETIETKDQPHGIAVSPDGKRVFVTHHESNYISIIDAKTNKSTGKITVKDHPAAIAISFDGSKAYVGHSEFTNYKGGDTTQAESNSAGSNEICIVDLKTEKVTSSIPTRGSTWSIAVKSDGSQILATTYEPYIGSFKDFQTLSAWTHSYWNGITVIDPKESKITSVIDIAERITPRSIALTPDEKKAYIIGSGSDEARVLDMANLTITKKIPLGLGG